MGIKIEAVEAMLLKLRETQESRKRFILNAEKEVEEAIEAIKLNKGSLLQLNDTEKELMELLEKKEDENPPEEKLELPHIEEAEIIPSTEIN
jgi:hypothetical protein